MVDAHTSKIINVRPASHTAANRILYDYPSTTPMWVEGDDYPEDDFDAMSFLNAAEDYYNTLYNMFGWKSYDNRGMLTTEYIC